MLVAAGASLTIKDNSGSTPRQLAQMADDQELAAYLESKCNLISDVSPSDLDNQFLADSDVFEAEKGSAEAAFYDNKPSDEEEKEQTNEKNTERLLDSDDDKNKVSLNAQNAACAQALSQALVDVLKDENVGLGLKLPCQKYDSFPQHSIPGARPQEQTAKNKRLRTERLI